MTRSLNNSFTPVLKQRLPDGLAQRINRLIQSDGYQPGDRLPSISEMARSFGVGPATLREALNKLETVGLVVIKHGSGVYVSHNPDTMLISNPIYEGAASRKLLLDLIDARFPIETTTAALAARHATDEQLEQMERVLQDEAEHMGKNAARTPTKMSFHRKVAEASGNAVLFQILEVMSSLFQQEQDMILNIYSSKRNDHAEHREIFEALKLKDEALTVELMRAHLARVKEILLQWNPDENPINGPL